MHVATLLQVRARVSSAWLIVRPTRKDCTQRGQKNTEGHERKGFLACFRFRITQSFKRQNPLQYTSHNQTPFQIEKKPCYCVLTDMIVWRHILSEELIVKLHGMKKKCRWKWILNFLSHQGMAGDVDRPSIFRWFEYGSLVCIFKCQK